MMQVSSFEYPPDLKIVNAARGSYGVAYDSWSEVPRTARGRSDSQLIQDLSEERHTLPFRHVHPTVRCVAPLPIARQLSKQQVGFSWSEISRRYRKSDLTFYFMGATWRASADVRQGVGVLLPPHLQTQLDSIQRRNVENCLRDFHEALSLGAALEQARMLLPQSMEVTWVWTGSLLGWADLYLSRTRPDTQLETTQIVREIAAIIQPKAPAAWEALTTLR